MGKTLSLLLITALVLGLGLSHSVASQTTHEHPLAEKHLENLNLVLNLYRAGKTSLLATTRDPKSYLEASLTGEIASWVETYRSIIYGYDGAKIPAFLADHFDRIFEMIFSYLDIKRRPHKLVIWVVDLQTLTGMFPLESETLSGEPPPLEVGFYTSPFDFLFFTPPIHK